MTNSNNNTNQNKYIPNQWKLNIPSTATVSYYNPETDQNLTQEEWRALNSTSSEQIRIVNQGETYRSWKTNIDEFVYGPMFNFNNNDFYCPYGSCQNKVSNQGAYCSMHSSICLECSVRIPSGYNYCPKHINACVHCSKRVSSDEDSCPPCLQEAKMKAYHEIMSALEEKERREKQSDCSGQ